MSIETTKTQNKVISELNNRIEADIESSKAKELERFKLAETEHAENLSRTEFFAQRDNIIDFPKISQVESPIQISKSSRQDKTVENVGNLKKIPLLRKLSKDNAKTGVNPKSESYDLLWNNEIDEDVSFYSHETNVKKKVVKEIEPPKVHSSKAMDLINRKRTNQSQKEPKSESLAKKTYGRNQMTRQPTEKKDSSQLKQTQNGESHEKVKIRSKQSAERETIMLQRKVDEERMEVLSLPQGNNISRKLLNKGEDAKNTVGSKEIRQKQKQSWLLEDW